MENLHASHTILVIPQEDQLKNDKEKFKLEMNKTNQNVELHKNNIQNILENINFNEKIKEISHK